MIQHMMLKTHYVGNSKVVPVHTIKAEEEKELQLQSSFTTTLEWSNVVRFTPLSLYPLEKSP